MFIGEFVSGLIIYLYQQKFLKKEQNNNPVKLFAVTLIQGKNDFIPPDNKYKIYLLIFFSAIFD